MATRHVAGLVTATALLVGCSGDEDNTDDGPLFTGSTYYEVMRVGDFADLTEDPLDDIGVALCSDVRALDDDETRRACRASTRSADRH